MLGCLVPTWQSCLGRFGRYGLAGEKVCHWGGALRLQSLMQCPMCFFCLLSLVTTRAMSPWLLLQLPRLWPPLYVMDSSPWNCKPFFHKLWSWCFIPAERNLYLLGCPTGPQCLSFFFRDSAHVDIQERTVSGRLPSLLSSSMQSLVELLPQREEERLFWRKSEHHGPGTQIQDVPNAMIHSGNYFTMSL